MLHGTFSLGFWRLADARLSPKQINHLVNTAIDENITIMDHADIYGNHSSEQLFGDAMQLSPKLRDSLFIISKCGIKFPSEQTPQYKIKHYNYSEKAIIQSVEHSLQHLKTDYLDALLLHRPSPLMDIHEIESAISTLISSGKIKHAGVSNFTCQQFTTLIKVQKTL